MSKNKIILPNVGDLIEITARHCSGKLSPLLQIGRRYVVKDIAKLKDGTPVIEVAHPTRKKATLRVNAARFDWKVMTIEDLQEERFKKEVAEDTSKLTTEFTQDEQISIAFVPLIFNHIAWMYAMKAVQKSVDYRVSILKKITRAVRQLRQDYEREVSKDLDYRHQKHIEEQTERFVAEFQKDFTILYFCVNQEFIRKMPDWPYNDLRTYAIISMLMIRFVDEHNKRMGELIASRLGKSNPAVRMPIMDALHTCMDAYAGEVGRFNYGDANVKMAMNVIANDVKKIKFDIL